MSQNLSSAAVVIGALGVKLNHFLKSCLQDPEVQKYFTDMMYNNQMAIFLCYRPNKIPSKIYSTTLFK